MTTMEITPVSLELAKATCDIAYTGLSSLGAGMELFNG